MGVGFARGVGETLWGGKLNPHLGRADCFASDGTEDLRRRVVASGTGIQMGGG